MHVPVALGAERDLLLVGHEHLPRMNNEWLIWSERSKQRSHLGWSWAQHQISAARQVRLLCPPPIFRAGSSTDQNSWPTPNRCGLNSRTAHQAGLARRSSPQSIIARRWFDSNIPAPMFFFVQHGGTGRDGRRTRPLIETRPARYQRHPPNLAGSADMETQSPVNRVERGSHPAS